MEATSVGELMGSRVQGGYIDQLVVIEDSVMEIASCFAAPFPCTTLVCFQSLLRIL